MSSTIHHIAFTVKNIDESIAWYKDKLGFTLIDTFNKDKWHMARIALEDLIIELFNFEGETKPIPAYRNDLMNDLHVVGTKHVCLQVDDLQKTINDLRNKGVEIIGEKDTAYFGGNWIFIKDCNGILIELYQGDN